MADVIWNEQLVLQIAKAAAMSALRDGAEAILTESHTEIPHDSGTMQRSGTVTEAPSENAVYISFNTPYAVKQHEDLTLRHSAGRKAKYLEDPFNRNTDRVLRLAQTRVSRALRDRS